MFGSGSLMLAMLALGLLLHAAAGADVSARQTVLAGLESPSCFGNKQCGAQCCGFSEECKDASKGLCCKSMETQCNNKCCPFMTSCFSGTCCSSANQVCGSTCCGITQSCANPATGMCCGATESGCGNKCCHISQKCVSKGFLSSAEPISGPSCCPVQRTCGDTCCKSSDFCGTDRKCHAPTCENLFDFRAKTSKGCSNTGALTCSPGSPVPAVNWTCGIPSQGMQSAVLNYTESCTSGDFKCYRFKNTADSSVMAAFAQRVENACPNCGESASYTPMDDTCRYVRMWTAGGNIALPYTSASQFLLSRPRRWAQDNDYTESEVLDKMFLDTPDQCDSQRSYETHSGPSGPSAAGRARAGGFAVLLACLAGTR